MKKEQTTMSGVCVCLFVALSKRQSRRGTLFIFLFACLGGFIHLSCVCVCVYVIVVGCVLCVVATVVYSVILPPPVLLVPLLLLLLLLRLAVRILRARYTISSIRLRNPLPTVGRVGSGLWGLNLPVGDGSGRCWMPSYRGLSVRTTAVSLFVGSGTRSYRS